MYTELDFSLVGDSATQGGDAGLHNLRSMYTGPQTSKPLRVYIQEIFVSNIEKVENAMMHAEAYDMMAILMVPSVANPLACKPSEKFNDNGKNLFVHSLMWKKHLPVAEGCELVGI